jgi:hypothetical protein
MGWKTILGAVVWGVGQLAGPDVAGYLTSTVAGAIQAVGGVLAIIGARHAIAKRLGLHG